MERQTYQAPQMDVVQMNINKDVLLAGSPTLDGGDFSSEDPILAPELDL